MTFTCHRYHNDKLANTCGTNHRTIAAARRCRSGRPGFFDRYECRVVNEIGQIQARFVSEETSAIETDRRTISFSASWHEVPV